MQPMRAGAYFLAFASLAAATVQVYAEDVDATAQHRIMPDAAGAEVPDGANGEREVPPLPLRIDLPTPPLVFRLGAGLMPPQAPIDIDLTPIAWELPKEEEATTEPQRRLAPLFFGLEIPESFVLLLDRSGSMGLSDLSSGPYQTATGDILPSPSRLDAARSEAGKVLRELEDDDRFALVTFGEGQVTWYQTLVEASSANRDAAQQMLEAMHAAGSTPLAAAIERGCGQYGADLEMLILVTDGEPHDAQAIIANFPKQFQALANKGCRFVAIHIGASAEGREFLSALANSVNGGYVQVE